MGSRGESVAGSREAETETETTSILFPATGYQLPLDVQTVVSKKHPGVLLKQ